MKLSLDQLQVDSYATQANEKEATEIKGGTTPGCLPLVWVIIAMEMMPPPPIKPVVTDSSLLPPK